jgi:hypothetical protein
MALSSPFVRARLAGSLLLASLGCRALAGLDVEYKDATPVAPTSTGSGGTAGATVAATGGAGGTGGMGGLAPAGGMGGAGGATTCDAPQGGAGGAGVYPANCKEAQQQSTPAPECDYVSYTVDPDQSGPIAPFDVWCDVKAQGGGWTLVSIRERGYNVDLVESIETPSSSRVALTDPEWKALRDLSTQLLVKDGAEAVGAILNLSKMINDANCDKLGDSLSWSVLAHSEDLGCRIKGRDYCLLGDNLLSGCTNVYEQCKPSLSFFDASFFSVYWTPTILKIFVR